MRIFTWLSCAIFPCWVIPSIRYIITLQLHFVLCCTSSFPTAPRIFIYALRENENARKALVAIRCTWDEYLETLHRKTFYTKRKITERTCSWLNEFAKWVPLNFKSTIIKILRLSGVETPRTRKTEENFPEEMQKRQRSFLCNNKTAHFCIAIALVVESLFSQPSKNYEKTLLKNPFLSCRCAIYRRACFQLWIGLNMSRTFANQCGRGVRKVRQLSTESSRYVNPTGGNFSPFNCLKRVATKLKCFIVAYNLLWSLLIKMNIMRNELQA